MKRREIKFRVWHKPEQKMHHYLKAKFGQGTNITLEGKFKDVDRITTKTVPNEDLEVLQLTGFLDKNGIEIYEGDVLDVIGENSPARIQVVWDAEEGWWGYLKITGEQMQSGRLAQIIDHRSEILGNIYETPDILATLTL